MAAIKNIEGEIWKPIPEWEEFYEVSNKGRVKMLLRTVLRKNGTLQTYQEKLKKLSPAQCNKYLMVTLTDRRRKRHETKTVHRLVAIMFIPNPLNLPEVNHLKTKNDITEKDLEWSSRSDNQKDAYRRGLVVSKKGAQHIFARKVGRYLNGKLIEEYETMSHAESSGYSISAVRQAIKNDWKCGGFDWKYLSERKWTRRASERDKKSIVALNNGVVYKTYRNIDDVIKEGHDSSNIYKALKNQKVTSGGFSWKYLDEKAA